MCLLGTSCKLCGGGRGFTRRPLLFSVDEVGTPKAKPETAGQLVNHPICSAPDSGSFPVKCAPQADPHELRRTWQFRFDMGTWVS